MNFNKKFFLTGFLAVGILFSSGCDGFSYESKSESSVEVNSSGINTSSSYKETKAALNGVFSFKANDVNLKKGSTEFNFSITNSSNKDTTLKNLTISFKAVDENNKLIREGSADFENLSVKLPAGQEIYENFVIEDDKVDAFNGSFNVDYEFSNVVFDPPVQDNAK